MLVHEVPYPASFLVTLMPYCPFMLPGEVLRFGELMQQLPDLLIGFMENCMGKGLTTL